MAQIAPAAASLGPRGNSEDTDYLRRLEFASVELGLKNLMTFPCIRILANTASSSCMARPISASPAAACCCADPATGRFEPAGA